MAEQTIDKLQIEIESNADVAGKGMERICASIKKLSSAVRTGIPGLEQLSRQMEEFSARTAPLGKAFSQIDSPLARLKSSFSGVSTPLGRLKDAFSRIVSPVQRMKESMSGMSVQNFANSIRALEGMGNSLQNIQALGKGFNSLSNALSKLNGINVGQTAQQLQQIAFAVGPLADGVGKSTSALSDFGKGMNSLTSSLKRLNTIDLGETAQKVREMSVALRPLTDEMLRAGPAAASYGENMRNLAQAMRTASNAGTLTRSLAENTKQLSGITSFLNFGKLAAGFYALKRAGEFLGGFIQNTNSYIEDMNLFAVSMGEAAAEGRELAGRMEELLGIDAGEAMRSMGVFRQMTTSFGVAGEQATLLSKNLTQLTYDMSSFYNIDAADAFLKLRSGIAGEAEPLRALGVDISNARLQQELWNLGINASVEGLNQADKALLRYTAIMNQTANAQGDMARTLSSPANQLRVLEAQLGLASRAIGSIFIPALNAVLPYAIAFVKVVRMAAESLASFFGFQMPDVDYSGISAGLGDISSGLDDTASSAASAGKQLKKLISGFDELNIFQENSAAGSVGGAIGGNILGDLDLSGYDMFEGLVENRVSELIEPMRDALKEVLGYVGPIAAGIAAWKITDTFLKGISSVREALRDISGMKKIAISVGMITAGVTLGIENISSILSGDYNNASLTSAIKTTLSGALVAAGLTVAGLGLWTFPVSIALAFSITNVVVNWDEVKGQFSGIWDTIRNLFTGNGEGAVLGIEKYLTNTILQDSYLNELAFSVADGIFGEGSSERIIQMVQEKGWLPKALENMKTSIEDKLNEIKESIAGSFASAWNKVVNFFEVEIPKWWDETVAPWFTKEKWDELLYNIGHSMGEAVREAVQFWKDDIPKWWNEDVAPWFTLEKWQTLFSSISTSISNAIATFKENWIKPIESWWEEDVKPWFTLEKWEQLVAPVWQSIVEAIKDLKENWNEKIQQWWEEDVKKWFSWDTWKNLGTDAINALVSGLKSAWSGVSSFFSGFWDGIMGRDTDFRSSSLSRIMPYSVMEIPQIASFSAAPAAAPTFAAATPSAVSYISGPAQQAVVSSMNRQVTQYKASAEDSGVTRNALHMFGMDLIQALMQMQNQQEDRPIELHVTIGDKEVGQPAARWMRQQERISGINPGKL